MQCIYNVPNLSDVDNLKKILEYLNVSYEVKEDYMRINPTNMANKPIDSELSKKLRASYYFMGSLLGKYGHVEISFPKNIINFPKVSYFKASDRFCLSIIS